MSVREDLDDILETYQHDIFVGNTDHVLDKIIELFGEEHRSESYYVSKTPDGNVWTASRYPSEIFDQIQGRTDLTFERLDVFTRHRGTDWQPWYPTVTEIFARVIRRDIQKKQKASLRRRYGNVVKH